MNEYSLAATLYHTADVVRTYYEALLDRGFTEQQAMLLTMQFQAMITQPQRQPE